MTLRKLLVRAGWALIITLSAYYLYRAILYRYITPDQLGPSLFNKKLFYFGHLIAALPVLLGALLQFYTKLRYKWPLCRTPALYDSQLSICAHPGLAAHNRRHPGRLHIFRYPGSSDPRHDPGMDVMGHPASGRRILHLMAPHASKQKAGIMKP